MRRKLAVVLAPLTATAALVLPVAAGLGAHATSGGNHVDADTLYVRDSCGRFIGTLYRNEHFSVTRIAANGWARGWAYGNVNKCGFIVDPHIWLKAANDGHGNNPPGNC